MWVIPTLNHGSVMHKNQYVPTIGFPKIRPDHAMGMCHPTVFPGIRMMNNDEKKK
jgi:hypothetical protein